MKITTQTKKNEQTRFTKQLLLLVDDQVGRRESTTALSFL